LLPDREARTFRIRVVHAQAGATRDRTTRFGLESPTRYRTGFLGAEEIPFSRSMPSDWSQGSS